MLRFCFPDSDFLALKVAEKWLQIFQHLLCDKMAKNLNPTIRQLKPAKIT